jgi:hypothetical protein
MACRKDDNANADRKPSAALAQAKCAGRRFGRELTKQRAIAAPLAWATSRCAIDLRHKENTARRPSGSSSFSSLVLRPSPSPSTSEFEDDDEGEGRRRTS